MGAKALFLQVCLVFLIEINWTVLKTDSFHHTVAFHILYTTCTMYLK